MGRGVFRLMGCPVKGCSEKHLNLSEHFEWQRGQKSASVINPPVANAPVVSKLPVSKQSESERVMRWQKENREKYNEGKREYMKGWMRKKRAHGESGESK
jgi:hypothetical protein